MGRHVPHCGNTQPRGPGSRDSSCSVCSSNHRAPVIVGRGCWRSPGVGRGEVGLGWAHPMTSEELTRWRKAERRRLLAARESLNADALERERLRIDAHLERAFPGLATARLAFCWPVRGEYDARPLMQGLRGRGAVTALPVVAAPGRPLEFRVWHHGA